MTAGAAGATGLAGVGFSGNTGTGGGDAGTAGSAGSCTFNPTATTSTKIPTVVIVTWSTSLSAVTGAHIDFGLTTSYGMTAPVDLNQPSYRTLLLGMKASRTYHYRIVAAGSGGPCTSPDQTIMTGDLPARLSSITVTTTNASALSGGFLITGQYPMNAATSDAPAYILDGDGDYVWWYVVNSDVTGAVMSYDGSHMWINDSNVPNHGAHVHRVTMDGLTDDDLSGQFTGLNHQLTVLPDESVAFYAYNDAVGCDDIKLRSPSGTVTTVVNSRQAENNIAGPCHLNNVQYSMSDDTLVFSDLDHDDVTKVTRAGMTVWVLNGSGSTFTGDSWIGGQHGLQIIDLTRILIFDNGNVNAGGSGASGAIEMQLDTAAKTALKLWSYTSNPAIPNQIMGDAQRVPNGNTIVAYSTKGALDEVDAGGNVLQQWHWPTGTTFGYIEKRATLYGPPPR